MNLVLRLYDPVQGRILLDGIDLRELDINELREQISYVPQIPLLFNASVAENIRIGKPEASDEAVHEAARQANASDVIDSLPDGYETILVSVEILSQVASASALPLPGPFLKTHLFWC